MKQNKIAIIVTAPIALVSLILAYIFNHLGGQGVFWANVMLGAFGSALLGLITAIINYVTERKRILGASFTQSIKALNNFRRFRSNDFAKGTKKVDIIIETILRIDEFDYVPLDEAYTDMNLLRNEVIQ